MISIEKKRAREQYVVEQMIRLYCCKNHRQKSGLCDECKVLCEYAKERSAKCPFMEKKTFCSNCRVHCYKSEMRDKIRQVMRFSGPRIMLYHPVMACWHVITSSREKRRLRRETSD